VSEPPHAGDGHDDHARDGPRHDHSSHWWQDLISNWSTYEAPFGAKLRLAARNALLRARLKPCCGHPGQPGC
jgi:hypothetical protein